MNTLHEFKRNNCRMLHRRSPTPAELLVTHTVDGSAVDAPTVDVSKILSVCLSVILSPWPLPPGCGGGRDFAKQTHLLSMRGMIDLLTVVTLRGVESYTLSRDAGLPPDAKTYKSMALREGMIATLEGLVSRADLNGKHAKLLAFSDGRWGTELVDGSERVRVKPANLVPCVSEKDAAASPGLAIITNGSPYLQKAWWFDKAVEKSAAMVARFKAAFVRDAPALGLSSEQIAHEQTLFDVPFLFDLSGGGRLQLPPAVTFLCNSTRLGISSLSVARLRVIIETADALNALGNRVGDAGAVARALSPMGFPIRPEDTLILMVALNLPAVCDAYVYSCPSDEVVAWRNTLSLDPIKLDKAMRTVVVKPTAKQKLVSRHVCFFCGASPLAASVCLSLCPGCECVAYCCEEHRKIDHVVAHQLECGCKKPFVSSVGVPVTPCHELSISRLVTETQKEISAKMPIEAPAASRITIVRHCCQAKGMPGPCPLPMGWEISPV